MITTVEIENLRGIRSGKLTELSPVTILVGPNNAGKSTCLEAIAMASYGTDVRKVADLVRRRGGSVFGALRHVVSGGGSASAVRVALDGAQHPNRATSFRLPSNWHTLSYQTALQEGLKPPLLCVAVTNEFNQDTTMFVAADGSYSDTFGDASVRFKARLVDVGAVRSPRAIEDAYTDIDHGGRLADVLIALSASMPSLVDLRILKEGDEFVLHTFSRDGSRVPTYLAGDGFKRLLELAAALAAVKGGVALLEEPECYQHPRYLREIVAQIRLAAAAGTQVILSTHSIELLDELLHAEWPEDAVYPTVQRVRLDEGQLRATTLSRADALVARDELVEDLRA